VAENVVTLQRRLEAAREFVIRHPGLTLIDLAEFDAFLKMDETISALPHVTTETGGENG